MERMKTLNIAQSSAILPMDDVIKVIWRHKDGTESSAIYGYDGWIQGSMIHGGDYEVPASIADYIKELL